MVLLTTLLNDDSDVPVKLDVDDGLLSERRGSTVLLCHLRITSEVDHRHFRR